MLEVLSVHLEDVWDERHWGVAMKSSDPTKTYADIKADIKAAKNTPVVDELPPVEQDWYRST